MDSVQGGIHVDDHLVDRRVAVGGQMRAIAAGWAKLVDRPGEREWRAIKATGELFGDRFVRRRARKRVVGAFGPPNEADAGLAEQQIGDHPGDRRDEDDDHPRQARCGFAVRSQDRAHQHRGFGGEHQP